uniref:Ovule protein n=1 Tax=Ascaris lumbricoides TaxID=6252 RepID=A0A0M3HUU6_ASCLU
MKRSCKSSEYATTSSLLRTERCSVHMGHQCCRKSSRQNHSSSSSGTSSNM